MNLELLEDEYPKQVQSCCFRLKFNILKYTMFEATLNNKYTFDVIYFYLYYIQAYNVPMKNLKMFHLYNNSAHRPYTKIQSSECMFI